MTLPGGQADKFGNRFEGWWTIRQFARLMEEEILWLVIESPWKEDEKFEFHLLDLEQHREHHQVKRRKTGVGNWSLAELESAGLLGAFFERVVKNPNDACIFASEDQAEPLRTLTARARSAVDFTTYNKAHLNSEKWTSEFAALRNRVHAHSQNLRGLGDEEIFNCLRRIRLKNQDEASLREDLLARLGKLVNGEPKVILAVLAQYAIDNAHGHQITAPILWRYLQENGFERLTGYPNRRLLEATDRLHKRMLSSYLGRDVLGKPILRPEVSELHASISKVAGGAIIVTGEAGAGKSEVLLQLRDSVEADGLPFLFLRVDQLPRCYSRDSLLSEDRFPRQRAPLEVLLDIQKMSGEQEPAVLFLDQVDQLSEVTAANVEDSRFFTTIASVFTAAKDHPSITVVVACREFDLNHDHRFRSTFGADEIRHIHLRGLPNEDVRNKVDELGYSSALSSGQMKLFSNPYHLVLLAQLPRPPAGAKVALETSLQLYERFWDAKRRQFEEAATGLGWSEMLDALVSRMVEIQGPSLSKEDIDDLSNSVDRLCSMNVLTKDADGRVNFFHPRFFDYIFARRFHRQHDSLTEYLVSEGQHLRLRNPMRMILTYARTRALASEDRMPSYLKELQRLLVESELRPHLSNVAASFLAQVSEPTTAELEIVEQMVRSSNGFCAREGQRILAGNEGWLHVMDSAGIIEDWFEAQEGTLA